MGTEDQRQKQSPVRLAYTVRTVMLTEDIQRADVLGAKNFVEEVVKHLSAVFLDP